MTIAIIGAGAAGSLFAAYLAKAGFNVLITDKDRPRVAAIQNNGITVISPSEDAILHSRPAGVFLPDLTSADYYLFCVKSWATPEAAETVSGFAGKDSIAVTFQNGSGNADAISRFFGRDRTASGTTTEGAFILEPSRIVHGGKGVTKIGMTGRTGHKEMLMPLITALNSAGLKAAYTDNPDELIWNKLAVNAAINPLTAITGCSNGFTAENPNLKNIIRMTVKEVCTAAALRNIRLEEESVYRSVLSVAENTSANKSSMLQDIISGRKTEIEDINGYIEKILEKELSCGISVNRILLLFIKALELKNN